MKRRAMVHDAYGSPELLKLREIDPPSVGDDEVLVRVYAASLNVGDCFSVREEPFVMRMMTGLLRPPHPRQRGEPLLVGVQTRPPLRGTLIVNSGTGARGMRLLIRLLKPLVMSPFASQNLRRYVSTPNYDDLVVLKDIVESGKLTPVVNQTYPLFQTPAALLHIEGGHSRGKVVITL